MRKGLSFILACGLLLCAGCTPAAEKRTFSEDGKSAVAYQETLLETQNQQTEQIAARRWAELWTILLFSSIPMD